MHLMIYFAVLTDVLPALIAVRIWSMDRQVAQIKVRGSNLRPAGKIIIESGVIYTISLLILLVLYVFSNNALYVVAGSVSAIHLQTLLAHSPTHFAHRLYRLWYILRI